MIYRDRDEYEEKEASVTEDAVHELLDGDEDEDELGKVEVPEEEVDDKWE